jgi:hypothetical protein
VLPSEVRGIVFDSASWNSRTESSETRIFTRVAYEAYVSSSETIPLDSIAVEFRSDRAAEDSSLVLEGWLVAKLKESGGYQIEIAHDSLRPAEPRYAIAAFSRTGWRPGQWGCPRSVRVIRRART